MLLNEHLTILEAKGTLRILVALHAGRTRFNALARSTALNMQVMGQRLSALETAGLVRRDQVSVQPPHTEYTLTALGRYYAGYAVPLVTAPSAQDDDLPF